MSHFYSMRVQMSLFYYTQQLRHQWKAECHFIIEFAFFLFYSGFISRVSSLKFLCTSYRGPEVELEHQLHHQHGLTKTVVPEDPKTQQASTETADLLLHSVVSRSVPFLNYRWVERGGALRVLEIYGQRSSWHEHRVITQTFLQYCSINPIKGGLAQMQTHF